MKILYVTAVPLEYSSSANFRNIALIRGLIENGHSVSTLSTSPQKSSSCFDGTILNIEFEERFFVDLGQLHAGINAAKRGTLKAKIKSEMYKIYMSLSLYDSRKNAAARVSKIDFSKKKYDIIISSSDPKSSHLFAENLLKAYPNVADRWIQYWGDPFSGDINRRTHVPDFVIAKEEKRLLSLCDKAVYVSPLTSEYIKKKHPEYENKIHFVPVGYSEEKIYPKHESGRLDLCYCGDYNVKDRDLMPLIEAAREMNKECTLTLAGSSDLNIKSGENITVFPRVEKKKVDEIEENSNVIVCVCNRNGTQIPGKIYHASATNRCVLILLDGEKKNEIKKFLEAYDRFVFAENTKEKIIEALKEIGRSYPQALPCERLSGTNIAKEIIR